MTRGSRAREENDVGVQDCVDLMVSGRWVPGKSVHVIAEKHGVSWRTVENWATNASRIVRLAIQKDTEDIRAQLVATLADIVSEARDAGDRKAAVMAVAEQAKLLGLVVQRHEVQAMTPDEADRLIAEAKKLP